MHFNSDRKLKQNFFYIPMICINHPKYWGNMICMMKLEIEKYLTDLSITHPRQSRSQSSDITTTLIATLTTLNLNLTDWRRRKLKVSWRQKLSKQPDTLLSPGRIKQSYDVGEEGCWYQDALLRQVDESQTFYCKNGPK